MANNKVFMFGTQTLTTTNNGYYSDTDLQTEVNRQAMLNGAIYGKVTNQFAYNTFLRIASGVAYGLCELIASESTNDLGADTTAVQWASAFTNLATKSFVSDNYVPLSGAKTISGVKTFSSQIVSTVATGTAPLSVQSTTLVSNLNADKLDGQDGSYYLPANKQAVSNIGGLVTPDIVLTSNELVGIGTDGEQIRVQLGSGLLIDTSTSPYTIKVEHPITSITETTTEINITVG